jgi:MoxR-like ATPase
MLKVKIDYPTKDEELLIMRANSVGNPPTVNPVISREQIFTARKLVESVYMDEKIEKYILDIVFATRNPKDYGMDSLSELIAYGASPRASLSLVEGARATAFIRRRGYVIPEDVRSIAYDVLRHRIAVTYEAEAEEITSENIISEILNNVEVP